MAWRVISATFAQRAASERRSWPTPCPLRRAGARAARPPGAMFLGKPLAAGEDFELCCTAMPSTLSPLVDDFHAQFGIELTRIGSITRERSLRLMHADGSEVPLTAQAYDHFQR